MVDDTITPQKIVDNYPLLMCAIHPVSIIKGTWISISRSALGLLPK